MGLFSFFLMAKAANLGILVLGGAGSVLTGTGDYYILRMCTSSQIYIISRPLSYVLVFYIQCYSDVFFTKGEKVKQITKAISQQTRDLSEIMTVNISTTLSTHKVQGHVTLLSQEPAAGPVLTFLLDLVVDGREQRVLHLLIGHVLLHRVDNVTHTRTVGCSCRWPSTLLTNLRCLF